MRATIPLREPFAFIQSSCSAIKKIVAIDGVL